MTDKAAARGSVWSDNQRVEMQQKANESIVKDGYTPKPKIIKKADDDQKAADQSAAEPLVDGQNDSNTIVIDFNKTPS